jgi:pyruvate,water dikinase
MNMNLRQKNILKGIPVSPAGQVQGKVKVIDSLESLKKLGKEDILVSSFLTPDFISFIKKNSRILGIITNEGCRTCHAAILARELKIPYIAATINATKKLRNNTKVIMNSDIGIIYEA